jgi:hypothetical protein
MNAKQNQKAKPFSNKISQKTPIFEKLFFLNQMNLH